MDSNRGRYVRIQLILFRNYYDFIGNNASEYNAIRMAIFECPNNIKFRTLAIKLEQHIYKFTTDHLNIIEFKFNYDVRSHDEILYDVGLKKPTEIYNVWIYAPHFYYVMFMSYLREQHEEKEQKKNQEISVF